MDSMGEEVARALNRFQHGGEMLGDRQFHAPMVRAILRIAMP
jgi:hypothetical protein